MANSATPNDGVNTPPCDVCGYPSRISDGMCGANICESFACFEIAWDRAFPGGDD